MSTYNEETLAWEGTPVLQPGENVFDEDSGCWKRAVVEEPAVEVKPAAKKKAKKKAKK